MHRSGTSALAHVLEMMGAYLGEPSDLLPPHPQDNPKGYWERVDLLIEHENFLRSIGFDWDRIASFDAEKIADSDREQFATKLRAVVPKLEKPNVSWLVKDPRLCLLLSQWLPIVGNAACIVVVRDPREIAASMRESHRGFYTSNFLIALWEKYIRSALSALRGKPAIFVSYNRLLEYPLAESSRMYAALKNSGVRGLHLATENELREFLDPQLKRSNAKPHMQLSPEQVTLFAWLQMQCEQPAAVNVSDVPEGHLSDATLQEFERVLDHAAKEPQTGLGESTQWQEQLEAAIASSQATLAQELSETRVQVQQAHSESGSLMKKLAEREQAVHSLEVERARLEQSAAQRLHECEQLHERIASLVTAHEQHERRLSTLTVEVEQQRHQSELLRSDNANSQRRINELSGELAQRRHEEEALQHEIEEHRHRYEIADRELTDLQFEREQHIKQITQLSQESAQRAVQINELSFALDQQRARSVKLATHASALEQSVRAMQTSLSWRITAPARYVGKLLTPVISWNIEQKLYRLYYGFPGVSVTRKRALILWLHEHAKWLTRQTFSYRLNEQAKQIEQERSKDPIAQPGNRRMDQQRADALLATMEVRPVISIVMPVFNVERRWLIAAVESVRKQFYPHWELCIADDASTQQETRLALSEIAKLNDQRIKIHRLQKNVGIAGASNAAVDIATGEFVGLLDNDDELTRDALLEAAIAINVSAPDLIYSDEDKLDDRSAHVEPHFKPDFSIDYLFSNNYICHFAVIRRALLKQIGAFRHGFDGAQDFDLMLRISEHTQKIVHIPKVLYHWRKIAGSTSADSSAKPKTTAAGMNALSESLQRRGLQAGAELGPYPNTFRVRRTIQGSPLVSILIPFRDKPELLRTCVESIIDKTRYPHYEIVCIDNQSTDPQTREVCDELMRGDRRVRFIHYDAPFNYSAINNFAADQSKGDFLAFLNNDTEIVSEEWLDAMLEHAQRPDVGVVGAKLLYPDQTVQHAGVVIGLGGVAGHGHAMLAGDHPGYFGRARLIQNLSAVTFACAMTRRDVFQRLDGLNDRELKVAFNDVDYCLRARELGYLIVYTPYAVLMHYESKSRGYEDTPEKLARFHSEVYFMQKRHDKMLQNGDPYYNVNLSLTIGFNPTLKYVDELPS
jgi:O-antigen biosynthesis protein